MARTEITRYKYDFRNTAEENVAIVLLLNNDDLICMAAFIDNDAQELPPPREALNGVIYVTYRYKWLKDLVDMLRNEEPVYFSYSRESQVAIISTEQEAIGEEERKGLLKYLFG